MTRQLGLALLHHEQVVRGLVGEEARWLDAGRNPAAARVLDGGQGRFREVPCCILNICNQGIQDEEVACHSRY